MHNIDYALSSYEEQSVAFALVTAKISADSLFSID
jgi:hypothetical protein